jgi:acetyl esterase/lipase
MFLLTLGVGAPEVCHWLLVLNGVTSLVVLVGMRRTKLRRLALGASLLGLFLSALPLVQLPGTQQRMQVAIGEALGREYIAPIPRDRTWRSQPFVLADAFRGIDPSESRYTSGIRFAIAEGVPLSMDIYRPPQVGKYPALVVIYGGAWRSGNPANNANFNRYMAARGYTVFAIDYRHTPWHRFPAQLEDVRTALEFIRQHGAEYEADLERMVLLGRSAGAHLAMLAAYQPDALPVRAVVSYYGPVNLTEGYAHPPFPDPIDTRAVLEAFLGGSPDKLPDLYRVASPISYVKRPLPPTLLVHGSRDSVVQFKYAQQMYKRLRAIGNTAVLLEIPWAEHAFDAIFQGPSNQLALYYTERFLAWALR